MKIRVLKNFKINPPEGLSRGKHCIISKYKDKVIKIFDAYPMQDLTEDHLKEFHWGDYPSEMRPQKKWCRLPEATVIQNICWLHDLAPRVYEIVGVEIGDKKYFAQIQEEEKGEHAKDAIEYDAIYEKVKELGLIYGFKTEKDDVSCADIINGKLVDFNTFHFSDDHMEKIRIILWDILKYGKIYYQNEKKLGLNGGPRQSEDRINYMRLDKISFYNKTVSDLGCAGGFFCRYAKSRGSKKTTGYDFEDVIGSDTRKGAYLISNELGYYDLDFVAMDLRVEKPEPADIVFLLSLNYHIGIPEWLPEVTNEICIFEDNSKLRNARETLEKMFKKVELVGFGEDHGSKPCYICYK